MKQLILIFILLTFHAYAQQPTVSLWDEEARSNKRLLPKYGTLPKTDAEKEADAAFIKLALQSDSTHRRASDHLVKLGFSYLYKDLKTAMYRFNQAYLLDSTNSDIYWGYGGVYMVLNDLERAKSQYLEGLAINPTNHHLLTDYATYFMMQASGHRAASSKDINANLDSAITYLNKSYKLDPKDQNTCFKLSVCFFRQGDCESAVKYYKACMALGGMPIPEQYTVSLKKSCKL